MAPTQRPLTAADLQRLMNAPIRAFRNDMLAMLRERWPHQVHYTPQQNEKPEHVPPCVHRFPPRKAGPSDCVWIVPGTAGWRI